MENKERLANVLSAGEELRWSGKPVLGKFLDKDNRSHTLRWMIVSGVLFVVTFVAYYIATVKNDTAFSLGIVAVLLVIFALIALDPYTTYRRLKKTVYAVTDRRIIVCNGDSSHYDLPLERVDSVKAVVGQDGQTSLILSSAIADQAKATKLRKAGLIGAQQKKGDDLTSYPVFYNISDPDEVIKILPKQVSIG